MKNKFIYLFSFLPFLACYKYHEQPAQQQQPPALPHVAVISFTFRDSTYSLVNNVSCVNTGYYAITGADNLTGLSVEIDLYAFRLFEYESNFYGISIDFSTRPGYRSVDPYLWQSEVGTPMKVVITSYQNGFVSGEFSGPLYNDSSKNESQITNGSFKDVPLSK